MKQTTVQQLRENVRQWQAPDGTQFYVHNIQMADGVQGYALGKSETAPYEVGDAVEYEEHKQTPQGLKLKVRKPYKNENRGSSNTYKGKDQESIKRQSALKIAAFMLGAGKTFQEYQNCANECLKFFANKNEAPQVETRNDFSDFNNPF